MSLADFTHILVLDTEASGVPLFFNARESETDYWPHILQLAWLLYDAKENLIKEQSYYLQNPKVKLTSGAKRIHQIDKKKLALKGVEKHKVLTELLNDIDHNKTLFVAHFAEFDLRMLNVELKRLGLPNDLNNCTYFCTMLNTKSFNNNPKREYPDLSRLYQALFNQKMKGQHNALYDAQATADCFFELKKLDLIKTDNIRTLLKNHRSVPKPKWLRSRLKRLQHFLFYPNVD